MRTRSAYYPLLATVVASMLATGSFACSKTEPPTAAATAAVKPAEQARAQPVAEDTSYRRPGAERVVAIGDLHGDLAATRAALRLAGALGDDNHWAGGKLVVVQTGDQLDRWDDEPDILDLLERLAAEAHAAGGALYALNGNHEVMNVQGDFRYVTEDGFRDYQGETATGPHEHEIRSLPEDRQGRAAAFLSGRAAAKRLAQRPIVLQVGDTLFVHGGILPAHVDYGLGRINREAQVWMEAAERRPAPGILDNQRGPIWLRAYSEGTPPAPVCQELERVLQKTAAKRLVVGHTVQREGINSACGGRVWRIDVGLSRAYGSNPASVLEIRGDETRVLRGSVSAGSAAPSASASPSISAPKASNSAPGAASSALRTKR